MCSRPSNVRQKKIEIAQCSAIKKAGCSSRKDYRTELCVPETALLVIFWNSRQISFGLAFLSVTAVFTSLAQCTATEVI